MSDEEIALVRRDGRAARQGGRLRRSGAGRPVHRSGSRGSYTNVMGLPARAVYRSHDGARRSRSRALSLFLPPELHLVHPRVRLRRACVVNSASMRCVAQPTERVGWSCSTPGMCGQPARELLRLLSRGRLRPSAEAGPGTRRLPSGRRSPTRGRRTSGSSRRTSGRRRRPGGPCTSLISLKRSTSASSTESEIPYRRTLASSRRMTSLKWWRL